MTKRDPGFDPISQRARETLIAKLETALLAASDLDCTADEGNKLDNADRALAFPQDYNGYQLIALLRSVNAIRKRHERRR